MTRWLCERTGFDASQSGSAIELNHREKKQVLSALNQIQVLDPAVGEGVFLLAAANWLENTRQMLNDASSPTKLREEIVTNNLFGVDLLKNPIGHCKRSLSKWVNDIKDDSQKESVLDLAGQIKRGNSLVGCVRETSPRQDYDPSPHLLPFHWHKEFPETFQNKDAGFDVVIGNPPYGNILSDEERKIILSSYDIDVSRGRFGSWNVAALFVARSRMLMKKEGQLGFLLPNSILRVGQFSKIRNFILKDMQLWEIVDESNPFADVTLEMVSIFCKAGRDKGKHDVKVVSRRKGVEGIYNVPWEILASCRIFPLYFDDIYLRIFDGANRNILTASRGRDIPAQHVSTKKGRGFRVPYATKGRSVKRYRLDFDHIIYADNWFNDNPAFMDSFENEFLIATKNYPYPRCVMKPKGILHGGGAVRIGLVDVNLDARAIGMILNSRLARYVSTRYLTNYSQLTTCLNTGIIDDMPIKLPDSLGPFAIIFDALQNLHTAKTLEQQADGVDNLESIADALVYELYLRKSRTLYLIVKDALQGYEIKKEPETLCQALSSSKLKEKVDDIMNDPLVKRVESSPRMG
ncbi:MAG: DNA methyltransferase [Candidatus Thorarchaeota archaeon]